MARTNLSPDAYPAVLPNLPDDAEDDDTFLLLATVDTSQPNFKQVVLSWVDSTDYVNS